MSLIAPHQCVSCGAEGSLLCEWCEPDALESLPERCFLCKQLSSDSTTCQQCCRTTGAPSHVWVCTLYDGTAKQLIEGLKFGRKIAAADVIAEHMVETLPYISQEYVLVHVPTATSRVRHRGYDQSELIAKRLAKQLDVRRDCLVRRRGQVRQVGSTRAKRLKQLEGVFEVLPGHTKDKRSKILLVDDISTTGSTLMTVSKSLRKAGYRYIDAVIYAQKE